MFQEIAWTWYQELNDLGHTEHWVATHDSSSAQYLHQKGVERVVGLLDQNNFSIRHCPGFGDLAKKKQIQTYRRSLFAGRWKYLLSELLLGHNIMMTDVDNIFTAKIPMDELEQSEYDVFYAFAGTIKSFPKYWFNQRGFTVCGGLNWWRAVPSVIEFVTQVVERCNCDMKVVEDCNCMCDDQVVLNNLIFKGDYAILWNQTFQVPKTPQDLIWNETVSGVCNQTGHKVQVWERHRAYRGNLPGDRKDCPVHNWVAMPFVKNKTLMRHKWHNVCGLETVF